MNQIFGYQILPEDNTIDMITFAFEGLRSVSILSNLDAQFGQLRLFTCPDTHLQTWVSLENGVSSYVWGIPAHRDIAAADIPEWCAKIVATKNYQRFRELLGPFVVIVDEFENSRITFISDIIGARPIFIGKHDGHLVFGNDVWAMQQAGLSKGTVDYDAVSAWLAYGNSCGLSLFSDLRRLPPGSAIIYENGKHTDISYIEFEPKSETPTTEEVAENLHHIVSSTVKTLLSNHPRISIALSGGYDSRYLLALCSSETEAAIRCATVSFTEQEGQVASVVAKTLGLPLKMIPVNGSIWDLYDQVYHFTPDGFPISKFVTYYVAQQYPKIPMVNGFMGECLIHGFKDKILGKYENEWTSDLADVLQQRYRLKIFHLFRKDLAERIQKRSRVHVEEAVRKGSSIGKVFAWWKFFQRHRNIVSNNFLQHIDITEALLPFYSWELLSYKMEHDYRLFSLDIYKNIFQNHFPKLADIPHADDLRRFKLHSHIGARCTRRWARHLLRIMCNKEWLPLLRKQRAIPRSMGAATVGLRRGEYEVMTYWSLYLLEKKMRDAGVAFDWECI